MISTLRKLFRKDRTVYTAIVALSLITYGVILQNQFTVVDDLATFVNSEIIRNFPASLRTFEFQTILYSIYYHAFGITPIPHHITSILTHIVNAILIFTIIKMLFDRKTATIGAILFAVHPINTEVITWISGLPYLFIALVFNLTLLNYLKFQKTKNFNYYYWSAVIFIVSLVFIRAVWLVTLPLVLFLVHAFILEKKISLKGIKYLAPYVIGVMIFAVVFIGVKSVDRLATRAIEKPMNQQSLKPVIESAPYTVFTMSRLYLFPKDLMIYYDGNPVDQIYYVSMFIATIIYAALVLLFWKKNRPIAGILLILVILLAPTYSPVKVAWYLSERYLYYGTGFFTILLATIIIWISKKTRWPIVAILIVSILTIVYSIRAIIRNLEFKNTQTLARSTIRTSPHSIRGYDDLGGDYLLKGNYKSALPLFRKTLTILPDSNTAISNLGYIYILYGIPQTKNDLTENKHAAELLRLGSEYYKAERYTNAFYYLYQSSILDPKNPDTKIIMADIYVKTDQFNKAEKKYLEVLGSKKDDVKVLNKLAFVAFRQNAYDRAEQYLYMALKIDPKNQNVIDNIKLIEQTKQQSKLR